MEVKKKTVVWNMCKKTNDKTVLYINYKVCVQYSIVQSIYLQVRLLDNLGHQMWVSDFKQKPLYAPEEFNPDLPFTFNAYGAAGNVRVSLNKTTRFCLKFISPYSVDLRHRNAMSSCTFGNILCCLKNTSKSMLTTYVCKIQSSFSCR